MTRIPGRVSAIVTCFNREKYILPCLDSLLRQTYANLDIVIVDDCSTDGSVTKIRNWQRHSPPAGKGKISPDEPLWLRSGWPSIRAAYAKGHHCISVGTVLMRGRMFDQYGGMNNSAPGAEDAELVFRYLNKGVAINNLKEVLQYIRIHPLQRSRKYYGKNPAQ